MVRATDALADALVARGPEVVFGLVGSSNLHLINAIRNAGGEYVGACHEAGAVAMADGFARASGRVGVASVHQGPGVTNAATPLTEAARSGTPLVLLAPEAETRGRHSTQSLDPHALADAVGARAIRIEDPANAPALAARALRLAEAERTPVVLSFRSAALERALPDERFGSLPSAHVQCAGAASADDVDRLAEAFASARRPLVVAGRGAVGARAGPALRELADRAGALLATTIVAKGLFAAEPFGVGFLGGLGSPLATELALAADLFVGFGTSLDHWTTNGGSVPGPNAAIALVDDDPTALARGPVGSLAVLGDAARTAEALTARLPVREDDSGWRTPELADRIAAADEGEARAPSAASLDPHALTIALDRHLPPDRIVALDSGHFLAFPSMHMGSPDGRSFLFAQGFQSVGLGLGIAIGAAVAQPGRIVAAMIGDGGAKMSLLELDTAVRESLPVLVVVFDDGGYGAEVHDFEPLGVSVEVARFPSRDYAGIARALGAEAATVRALGDLTALTKWLKAPRRPLLLDCKVDPGVNAADALTPEGAAEWSMAIPAGAT